MNAVVRRRLLVLLLAPLTLYFAVVAFVPSWLARPCWPGGSIPLSLPLAIGLIWLGFAVTVLYVRLSVREDA
ncbi:DUF485 domain-containing protein [Paludibacterium yongneupense]|uniref:DUF485 domain-containing protein n=1 Tax=Paludibacterium yongneupense TaxID=400061 RepID=UPI0003FA28B0|nr:DUF485 domain-containing protein [Paludibacterium yongneupense]